MEIENVLIQNSNDKLVKNVEKTYLDSFPLAERRDFPLVRKLIDSNSLFKLYVFLQKNSYVGFITAWNFCSFTYLEHFAIDESARNGGIGRIALEQIINELNTSIVLEVELPEDEMSKRRIGFYERAGFTFCDKSYLQPSYRKGGEALELRLMSYGDIDLGSEFENVKTLIHRNVYGVDC